MHMQWIAEGEDDMWMFKVQKNGLSLGVPGMPAPGMPVFVSPQSSMWRMVPDGPGNYRCVVLPRPAALWLNMGRDKQDLLHGHAVRCRNDRWESHALAHVGQQGSVLAL